VEGPLASNPVYMQLLQALLPQTTCYASSDAVEGTARGAWMLAHWGAGTPGVELQRSASTAFPGLREYHQRWRAEVSAQTPHR
jgi:L-fuculokinase